MAELELHGSKKYIKYMAKHLPEEHPKTRGHIEVELESERKHRCKGTVWTGEF
jgi:hypothetical protein